MKVPDLPANALCRPMEADELQLQLEQVPSDVLRKALAWMAPLLGAATEGRELLTVAEVAKAMRVSDQMVRDMCEANAIAHTRLRGTRGKRRGGQASRGVVRVLRSGVLIALWRELRGKRLVQEAAAFLMEVCASQPTAALRLLRDHLDALISSRAASERRLGAGSREQGAGRNE